MLTPEEGKVSSPSGLVACWLPDQERPLCAATLRSASLLNSRQETRSGLNLVLHVCQKGRNVAWSCGLFYCLPNLLLHLHS